ncbi:MAG: acetyltransferase [Cyclobacteriaceae bacterium]|jgi:sugar O-acyltransferase (sialic acid O-acetyltransferase NeuD family)|nr:acetyltransferase [Cyclobacteriaceae bacterium]
MVKVILQGGGEHARVVLDCLLAQGVHVLALFDPKYSGELFGVPQRGAYNPDYEPGAKAIVAIGNNEVRKKVAAFTKHGFTNAQHPSCVISPYATTGHGNMLLHGCIVQPHTVIGNHVIVNTGASIDHDCVIGDYVHLAPRSVLCGRVKVGEGTLIGAGAVILPGIEIGAWATIGAGAVVTRNVPDGKLVKGNPAR